MSAWFHGGPRIRGHWVLPAAETGVESTSDICSDLDGVEAHDPRCVYVINSYNAAMMFAAVHRDPWVYEVEPDGDLVTDPDFTPGDTTDASMACSRARIIRRFKVSHADQDVVIRSLLGLGAVS